jgi:hypothetical protein
MHFTAKLHVVEIVTNFNRSNAAFDDYVLLTLLGSDSLAVPAIVIHLNGPIRDTPISLV